MAKKKTTHIVRLERDTEDRILPKGFAQLLVNRFLPVMSMTYIASIIGIALSKHQIIKYLFWNNSAYLMSLFVVIWLSGPAIIWVLLHSNPLLTHVAELWYKILSGLMVVTLALSFYLFPEGDMYGLRAYFIMSVPLFVLIFYMFVRDGLPAFYSYYLNAAGFCALFYGAVINIIF